MVRHIEHLEIRRFRGLRDLILPDLGLVNLLVGGNSSGKTTVLEALATFCRPLDPLEWLGTAQRREGGDRPKHQIESLKWLFPQDQVDAEAADYATHVTGGGACPVRESRADLVELLGSSSLDGAPPRVGARLTLRAAVDSPSGQGAGEAEHSPFTADLTEGQPYRLDRQPPTPRLPVQSLASYSHVLDRALLGRLSAVLAGPDKAAVLKVLQRLDPMIEDVGIVDPTARHSAPFIRHAHTGRSPVSSIGDGARRTLTMALAAVQAESGVLLVDDIESAIHRDALAGVFSWLADTCRQRNVQLFATTHSLEAVDAVLEAEELEAGDVATFRLPSPDRSSPVKRFDRDQLHHLRYEMGLDVR